MDLTMTDLKQFAQRAVDNAADKGFVPANWNNFPTKLMMVVCEIAELSELGSQSKKRGAELSDVLMRLLGILHSIFPSWTMQVSPGLPVDPISLDIERETWPLVRSCACAMEAWRRGLRSDCKEALQQAVSECFYLADQLNLDLMEAAEAKLAYNFTREKLHGCVESST